MKKSEIIEVLKEIYAKKKKDILIVIWDKKHEKLVESMRKEFKIKTYMGIRTWLLNNENLYKK